MRAIAVVRDMGGAEHELGHGDLVGRLPSARLLIDDPRISEAHAIISLRRGQLQLLALRRLVSVGGKTASEVTLRPGLEIQLADELALHVVRVVLPDRVRAIRTTGAGTRVLAQVTSIVGSPPRIVGRFEPEARALVWSTGDAWRLRIGRSTRTLDTTDSFDVDDVRFQITTVAIDDAGPDTTLAGATANPVRVVAFYDNVQIHRRGFEVLTLGGVGARILSELIACAGPTHWEVLATSLWSDEADDMITLRHRWDVALGRLRARLREAGVRELLLSDGSGRLALELYDGDEVDDRT